MSNTEPETRSAGPVETYEPLEAQPPGPPIEEPATGEEIELDARAPSVMPLVWGALAAGAVALAAAFAVFSASPPRKAPVYQAATPAEQAGRPS